MQCAKENGLGLVFFRLVGDILEEDMRHFIKDYALSITVLSALMYTKSSHASVWYGMVYLPQPFMKTVFLHIDMQIWLTARPLPGQLLRTPGCSCNHVKLTINIRYFCSTYKDTFLSELEYYGVDSMSLPIKHVLIFSSKRGATGTMGDPWREVTSGEEGLSPQH